MSGLDPGVAQLGDKDLAQRIFEDERVLVLFYADTDVHCKRFVPAFKQRLGEITCDVVAANISDRRDPRWDTYQIKEIPTLVLYQKGRELTRIAPVPGVGLHGRDLDKLVRTLGAL